MIRDKGRDKRDDERFGDIEIPERKEAIFNDELWSQEWYLVVKDILKIN